MIRYSPDGRFTIWHFPGADLDYGFDWTKRGYLQSDETITSSTWDVPEGVTKSREMISDDGTITAAFFAGGVDGTSYVITNHIVTSGGRTDARTITLVCKVW